MDHVEDSPVSVKVLSPDKTITVKALVLSTEGKRHPVEIESGMIGDRGKHRLERYLWSECGITIPRGWSWEWVVTKNGDKYQGTLPKRLAKLYKEVQGWDMPEAIKTEIGNLARRHMVCEERLFVDFTSKFNWHRGKFGDDGSCFWGGARDAKKLIKKNGGVAMRLYKTSEYKSSFSRAWFVPDFPVPQSFTFFNAYGLWYENFAIVAKSWLQQLLSENDERADDLIWLTKQMTNRSRANGILWINNGSGHVVGHKDDLLRLDSTLDLEWSWR